jgi:phosphatidylglycerol:prolipoprotein diacylglycerol transferase
MGYVHDLDPFLLQIHGDFGIRWYGLSYLVGFFLAYLTISWMSRRQRAGMTPHLVSEFITYGALGALIGGRLGYCVFYQPDLFLKFKDSFPFWGVLAVNEGGMASHGGMIGVVVATYLFSKKFGVHIQYLFDLVALASPPGLLMGRIANFINGELVGRPASADFPLAVKFPQDILSWPREQFTKLTELTPVVEKMKISASQWEMWIADYSRSSEARDHIYSTLHQIVQEIQNGQNALKDALAPLLIPRHPSQLYAALSEGLFVFIVLFIFWRRARKPGTVGALFFVLYACSRVLNEFSRLPDAHLGLTLGLSRGQWLSLAMFLVGITFLIIWSRSNSLPLPGWAKDPSVRLGRR